MDMDVNDKNKKRYVTACYPMHQGGFWTQLIWLLPKIALMGKPSQSHVITKMAFTNEEIYQRALRKKMEERYERA